MRRNIGQEKLLNVNSLSSEEFIMEISVRRIRETPRGTCGSATGSRQPSLPLLNRGVKNDIDIPEAGGDQGRSPCPGGGFQGLENPWNPLRCSLCAGQGWGPGSECWGWQQHHFLTHTHTHTRLCTPRAFPEAPSP